MITIILITVTLVLALTIASQEDMILHFIQKWAEKKEGKGALWVKPLITCPSCMPSLWTVIGYLFAWIWGINITWRMVAMYPIMVCASSVIVTIIWTVFLWVDIQIPYYTNMERLTHYDVKDRKDAYHRRNGRSKVSGN